MGARLNILEDQHALAFEGIECLADATRSDRIGNPVGTELL